MRLTPQDLETFGKVTKLPHKTTLLCSSEDKKTLHTIYIVKVPITNIEEKFVICDNCSEANRYATAISMTNEYNKETIGRDITKVILSTLSNNGINTVGLCGSRLHKDIFNKITKVMESYNYHSCDDCEYVCNTKNCEHRNRC